MTQNLRSRMEALGVRFIETPEEQVDAVRGRLQDWRDYHEGRSNSHPGKAYFASDKGADSIYQARKPTLSINTPGPELDLRVSDEAVQVALGKASAGEKYIF
jgi:hypothetical protein